MENITVNYAANITYDEITRNVMLHVEYEHTGKQYFKTPRHYTTNKDIAEGWKQKGKKVTEKEGYYFIKRIAIPITINDTGEKSVWYINNPGDSYKINVVSKYGRMVHNELSKEQPPKVTP